VLKGTWVFKRKVNSLGQKKKARWCARGDMQQHGLNFEETVSSVVRSMAYKMLFNRAAVEDMEIEQMDVDVAFLNGEIDGDVYIEQSEGFDDGTGRVCRLKRTLYGLRQSPRAWYLTLRTFLKSLGLRPAAADASVFTGSGLWVAVYIGHLHGLLLGLEAIEAEYLPKDLFLTCQPFCGHVCENSRFKKVSI
jgi:hypothetical protein